MTTVTARDREAPDPSRARRRNTTLVLGMHRSGTSVLTQALGLLGCHIGKEDELLPAHPTDNPTGYAERTDILAAHNRFLEEAGFGWNRLAGFDLRVIDSGAKQALQGTLSGILAEIAAADTPIAIKDPRLCLLLPLWRPLLDAPVFVVAVRDPREIVCSLADGPRGTYPAPHVLALWEKYIGSMLDAVRGEKALFVSYSNLLDDSVAQADRVRAALSGFGIKCPSPLPEAELRSLLDPRLRRSLPPAPTPLTAEQEAMYQWLEAQSRAPGLVKVDDFPRNPLTDSVLSEYESAQEPVPDLELEQESKSEPQSKLEPAQGEADAGKSTTAVANPSTHFAHGPEIG